MPQFDLNIFLSEIFWISLFSFIFYFFVVFFNNKNFLRKFFIQNMYLKSFLLKSRIFNQEFVIISKFLNSFLYSLKSYKNLKDINQGIKSYSLDKKFSKKPLLNYIKLFN